MAGVVDRCYGCSEFISRKFWAALLAELIGTMFLVIGACGSALAPAKLCGAPGGSTVQISLGFGFSVATMVWTTAHVSGGHINPAVSFGMVITRKISILRFILYVLCQCGGAIAGAAILKYTVPDEGTIGTSQLGPNVDAGQGFGIELLITFVLVLTVFSCVDPGRTDKGGSIPLTIGTSIAMCHLWAVPFTGAGMNAARVLGPAMISETWDDHWLYWAGPLVGAALAAIIYDFIFAVNATPSKVAGFVLPNYDDACYDRHGKNAGIRRDSTEMS